MAVALKQTVNGEMFFAAGRDRAEALERLVVKIWRATGMQATHQGNDGAYFEQGEHFAEQPVTCLPGPYNTVCFRNGPNGELVCFPLCSCGSSGACKCKAEKFSEGKKPMSRATRFDDDTDTDALPNPDPMKFLKSAGADMEVLGDLTPEQAAEVVRLLSAMREDRSAGDIDADFQSEEKDQQDAEARKFRAYVEKFSEQDLKRRGTTKADIMKAFRAEQSVNPRLQAADWMATPDQRVGRR